MYFFPDKCTIVGVGNGSCFLKSSWWTKLEPNFGASIISITITMKHTAPQRLLLQVVSSMSFCKLENGSQNFEKIKCYTCSMLDLSMELIYDSNEYNIFFYL